MSAIFSREQSDVRPVVVSFAGNPANVAKSAWFGRPWVGSAERDVSLPQDANNYFSLAVFRPDKAGTYRRQKAQFQALHAVMLDDVGSKVAMERLTLPPTWLLETSPGNHQAGYLLSEPLTDGLLADRLMNAIVSAGLCDPGANGPRARLARLPVAVNGKHEPPFPCRMVNWNPELKYSVQALADGLQLEMPTSERPKRQRRHATLEQPQDGDPVWIPRPAENAVIAALRDLGLYKSPLGHGKHDITCPWVAEHTGEVDGGTAYFEPEDLWPIGGFKCLHGHCAERHIRDLLDFLDIEISAARMKATIRIMAGEIHRVVDAAERELAQSHRHYQRGGLIVTIVTDPGTRETRVQEVTQPGLVRALAGAATWERFDARAEDWVRTDPPARHAGVLFDSPSYPHLPVLNGLARQPYLRPDGSLMTKPGYDAATGMFSVFNTRDFAVPIQPTRIEAEAALAVLIDTLAKFSFATPTDQAAALAAILTAVLRPCLTVAPMFHVKAHMPGSGKSYLCALMTAFATPQRGTPTTFPGDDEECRKLLLAELLRAPAVVEFDNLTGDLVAHKSLCTALTAEFICGRILGVSKTATVSTRTLFISSGNNVGPIQDMTRRCVTIHLDPGCEIPASRNFKRPHLIHDVLRERGRFVSAALTIVRAWIVAGRPKTDCKPLGNYDEWSDLCCQPLLWLGCADPVASVFEAMTEDPDRETLARLLSAWQAVFGNTAAMVREAIHKSELAFEDHQELREVLDDIANERGEINRRKLGRWIKRHAGRIVDGKRFVRAPGNSSSERWRVESVLSVLEVVSDPILKTVEAKNDNAYARASRGE
ncbi:hypothetical protein [Methylomonas koyamae]|uniref:hypothetical protein n=1 Tax=Methylomonas koyamae TaxID=702114 RepID=UPI0018D4890C|nr:hypothetical protein [Methylomonas koyamae]